MRVCGGGEGAANEPQRRIESAAHLHFCDRLLFASEVQEALEFTLVNYVQIVADGIFLNYDLTWDEHLFKHFLGQFGQRFWIVDTQLFGQLQNSPEIVLLYHIR